MVIVKAASLPVKSYNFSPSKERLVRFGGFGRLVAGHLSQSTNLILLFQFIRRSCSLVFNCKKKKYSWLHQPWSPFSNKLCVDIYTPNIAQT